MNIYAEDDWEGNEEDDILSNSSMENSKWMKLSKAFSSTLMEVGISQTHTAVAGSCVFVEGTKTKIAQQSCCEKHPP
ncbi:hypothetical protein Nepgr_012223 [Nepenthes gracilis]|uniref:Uncharacterized protein n=1 Tax=Nepenthes gracilis TaxID=150966 RepID=A0AAD3SGY3_NEPGR|nr:hypothetical protein Nepgr_012223 [Nepenthes gracilis]